MLIDWVMQQELICVFDFNNLHDFIFFLKLFKLLFTVKN